MPETTKSETLGQTHTNPACEGWAKVGIAKHARDQELESDYYGTSHTAKGKYYKDNKSAVQARDAKRMWINGKEVKKTHPLYKAGRYRGFEEAAFSSLENFKDSAQGQVYIITNPAWEGWVKVGMAVDASDRAGNYQTSSPFRDYELGYVVDTLDRRATEAETHARLGDLFEQRNEWFKCSIDMAKRIIDGVVGEENE